jgi:hypothetical protein
VGDSVGRDVREIDDGTSVVGSFRGVGPGVGNEVVGADEMPGDNVSGVFVGSGVEEGSSVLINALAETVLTVSK